MYTEAAMCCVHEAVVSINTALCMIPIGWAQYTVIYLHRDRQEEKHYVSYNQYITGCTTHIYTVKNNRRTLHHGS